MGCGCMETPGYKVKMQWMRMETPGYGVKMPGYGVWMHGDLSAWEDAMHAEHGYMETQGADAQRPLGMGCRCSGYMHAWRPLGIGCECSGCMETHPGNGVWMHGDLWYEMWWMHGDPAWRPLGMARCRMHGDS